MPAARWLAAGAVSLFVLSLFLPAIDGPGFPALTGMDVLSQGASGWRDGVVAWYANPVFAVAVVSCLLGRYRFALIGAVAGTLLALSSFSAGTVAQTFGRSVPAFSFAAGYYLWLLAFVDLILASAVGIYKESAGSGLR
jgi:hypothetical protein